MNSPPPIPRTEPNAPASTEIMKAMMDEKRVRVVPRLMSAGASCYQVESALVRGTIAISYAERGRWRPSRFSVDRVESPHSFIQRVASPCQRLLP